MSEPPSTRVPSLSRRAILSVAWIGVSLFGLMKLAGALGRSILPLRPKGEFGGDFDVGTLAELPDVGDPPTSYPAGRFYLVRTQAGLFAIHRGCTHLDCLVTWDEATERFVCPCHGSEFGRVGECLQGPAQLPLGRFPIRVVTPDDVVVAESSAPDGRMLVDPLLAPAAEPEATPPVPPESNLVVDTSRKYPSIES